MLTIGDFIAVISLCMTAFGLGYTIGANNTRKNPALQDSPPAAGRSMRHLPLRRSAILPGRAFCVIGDSNGISYYIKNQATLF